MTHAPADVVIEYAVADERPRRLWDSPRARGILLLLPAVAVAALFSLIPLIYLFQISLTDGSSFFFDAEYTSANYQEVFTRYMPAIGETVYLAGTATLICLLFGYPFAYILIRKVRYRELVRTMMTFPLFGPLYLAFGLFYILLPTGPLGGLFASFNINVTQFLFSQGAVLFSIDRKSVV